MRILQRLFGSTETAHDLERQLRAMLSERQLGGLASLALAVLRRAPKQGDMVRKAAELLARSGRRKEAEQMLVDMLDTAPSTVSPRLVSSVLAADGHPAVLERLREENASGRLPADAAIAVVQHLAKQKQIAKALDLARRALEHAPHDVDLHIETAGLLRMMNDVAGARRQLEIACSLAPQHANVLRDLGRLETLAGNHATAEVHLRAAAQARPDDIGCRLDLGRCLLQQKRFMDAADLLRKSSREYPDRGEVFALLGHVLRWCGQHPEALINLRRAVDLAPDNALAMIEMAQIREEIGEFEPALELHRRAAEARGNPSYNATIFCHALLAAGRGRAGWAANMNRVEFKALQALPGIRVWQGEPLDGKSIVVINEGGTGDQIRDACAYPDVISAAARVTITCEPRLRPLFQRSFPQARFLPVKPEQRVAEYERMLSKIIDERALDEMRTHDYCVLSPDLLYHYRGDDRLWGKVSSYLVPAPELVERWRERIRSCGPGFRIGISWRSGAVTYNRECFYTRLLDWGPILTLPGVHFFNVQYDECEEEVSAAETAYGIRIHRWPDLNLKDDFDGVSALLKQLDLVLAPNTTVLELAGALGVHGCYMVRVPIAYDYWRRKEETGQDRLYPSVWQVRGDRPWDTASLIANTVQAIRRKMQEPKREEAAG
jgi:tetratricopeptide (TPR) repeat protein